MGTKVYLGLDIGGTSVKMGLFDGEGNLLGRKRVLTPAIVGDAGFGAVTDGMRACLDEAVGGYAPSDVCGVCLACPFPVPKDGVSELQSNIDMDLAGCVAAIRAAFPCAAVACENDANAAAVGEMRLGAAKGVSDLVMITLGTGVGGGVVVDGKIVRGPRGAAGEFGHLCVNPGGRRRCGCGHDDCLEMYSSAKGLVLDYLDECRLTGQEPVELKDGMDSYSVFMAMERSDDAAARWAVHVMCDRLAFAMAALTVATDPALFVIGGGPSAEFYLFGDELKSCYRKYALGICGDTPIVEAALGSDAGMIGAGFLAIEAAF